MEGAGQERRQRLRGPGLPRNGTGGATKREEGETPKGSPLHRERKWTVVANSYQSHSVNRLAYQNTLSSIPDIFASQIQSSSLLFSIRISPLPMLIRGLVCARPGP